MWNYSRFEKLDVSESDSDEDKLQSNGPRASAFQSAEVLAELPQDLPEELALVLAAKEGQQHLVNALLDKGVSVNSTDPHGGTALFRAVESGIGNRSVIELLLRRRASLECKNTIGETPLSIAAAKGPVPLCEALMDAGSPSSELRADALLASAENHNEATSLYMVNLARAPPHSRGSDRRTALHHWARRGNAGMVQALLIARADGAVCDINGVTPLICATQGGNAAIVRILCEHSALVNHTESNGNTALITAVGMGDRSMEKQAAELAKVLLEFRACVQAVNSARATSPLVAAACADRSSIVSILLQASAGIDEADSTGRRALPCAAATGALELCKLLLERRADVNARSTNGLGREPSVALGQGQGVTALSIVSATGKVRLVEALLVASADPETTDERGNTPLMAAASKGSMEVCSMLISARASVHSKQASSGKTALLLAASGGHRQVCSVLLDGSADLSTKADSEAAPLHAAAANGHEEVCKLLLAARGDANEVGPAGQDAVALATVGGHSSLADLLRVGRDISIAPT